MLVKQRKPGPASLEPSTPPPLNNGATAAGVHTPSSDAVIMIGGGVSPGRGAMSHGFTGEELQAGLSDVRYIVTNTLLPAVNAATFAAGEIN